jgi:hypothetical protein
MLVGMKSLWKCLLIGSAIGAALCGCLAPQKELAHRRSAAPSLPQLVRLFSVQQMQLKPGALFISGKGSAAADGGKNTFTAPSPFSSYPFIRMTIKSDNAGELDSCRQKVQAVRENHQSIDIRGMGTFAIESVIDPPLNTGVFTLTQLDACGAAPPSTPVSTPVVSTAAAHAADEAIPAADLVAVPERYLDHRAVITGYLVSAVHFMDPVSSLKIGSEGQYLSGYFLTLSLAAESRLSLVHGAPGSILILEGTLTRITPTSLAAQSGATASTGYEFDVSNVVSIGPTQPNP